MHRKLLFSAAVACLLTSSLARAAVMSRDWKTAGDGLLTYDDVNQREWLDVPETLLNNHGSYENVVAQTAPEGLFAGFMPAKSSDVLALAQSAGIDTNTTELAINEEATSSLVNLLGGTSKTGNSSIGFLNEIDPMPPFPNTPRLIESVGVNANADFAGVFQFSDLSGLDPGAIGSIAGVWLYRSVPEPSSDLIALIGTAVLLLAAYHRRRIYII